MKKNPTADPHQTTPTQISPLFGGAKLILEETPKAITPFGGLASFIEFLDAVRTFNETIKSYNEARAEYARSLYELDATAGRMTP